MHVADVIRDHGLADVPVMGIVRSDAQAVGAFLDRPILFPLEGKARTFVTWGSRASYPATLHAADSATTALLARHCRVVVLATPEKDVGSPIAARAQLIYTTPHRPMSRDRYRVWVVSAPSSPQCPPARYPSARPASTLRPAPTS
jgi:hypothetical protein